MFTLRVGNLMPGEAGDRAAVARRAAARRRRRGHVPVPARRRAALHARARRSAATRPASAPPPTPTSCPTHRGSRRRSSSPAARTRCVSASRVALEDHAGQRCRVEPARGDRRRSDDARVIEVQPGERLDRDFILRWRVGGRELRELAGLRRRRRRQGRHVHADVRAAERRPRRRREAARRRVRARPLGQRWKAGRWSRRAARSARMIDTLTSRDRFSRDRVRRPHRVDRRARRSATATDRKRFRAVEALAKIEARGGTELARAARSRRCALAGGYDDRERVIVLVTDGQVGNEDHILRELAPSLQEHPHVHARHRSGGQRGVPAPARRARAAACASSSSREDRLDAVMAKVHRRIGTPVATELRSDGAGLDVAQRDGHAERSCPTSTPARRSSCSAATAAARRATRRSPSTGTSFGDPLKLTIARDPMHARRGDAGSRRAGRARTSAISRTATRRAIARLEREIVRASKQFSVLSRFTAFLAVDRSEVVERGRQARAGRAAGRDAGGLGDAEAATRGPRARRMPMHGAGDAAARCRWRRWPGGRGWCDERRVARSARQDDGRRRRRVQRVAADEANASDRRGCATPARRAPPRDVGAPAGHAEAAPSWRKDARRRRARIARSRRLRSVRVARRRALRRRTSRARGTRRELEAAAPIASALRMRAPAADRVGRGPALGR